MISRAILNLSPELRFDIDGEVNNEVDYLRIRWIIGIDAQNTAMYGTPESIPTWADIQAEISRLEEEVLANEYLRNREAATQGLLPEKMYLPAILEQAKADRDGGKPLCPEMENAVNIYSQILIDNPEPS